MNNSPLNLQRHHDIVCTATLIGPPVEPECEDDEGQVHADGEIWSVLGYEIRQALVQRYGSVPRRERDVAKRCADGILPGHCSGNPPSGSTENPTPSWLQQQGTSIVDIRVRRDPAADQLRFNE